MRSSLRRCLHRHSISQLPQIAGDVPSKRKFKSYPIDYPPIDIAEVRTEDDRLDLLVAIDRTSNFAFFELHERAATKIAGDFLRHLITAVPYQRILCCPTTASISPTRSIQAPRPRDQVGYRRRRDIRRPRLRTALYAKRHRSPAYQAAIPMDQRLGRVDEPEDLRSDRQTVPLRSPPPAANAPRRLHRCL